MEKQTKESQKKFYRKKCNKTCVVCKPNKLVIEVKFDNYFDYCFLNQLIDYQSIARKSKVLAMIKS